jgi:hypothetical protein
MKGRTAFRKSWRENLQENTGLPRMVKIGCGMTKSWCAGAVAVPAPREVDELMRKVCDGGSRFC